uniref:Uncharacterized protein n=1 Tax=Oryza glumipatula TaxID=40148 RepID=A0A0E0BFV5_9ORYZ
MVVDRGREDIVNWRRGSVAVWRRSTRQVASYPPWLC